MCGIAGMFDLGGLNSFDEDLMHRINETQFHRGPDEGAIHMEPGVALGHRRLAIIDLASGQQPMSSADGALCVVYNGEIYNYGPLRDQLIECGHEFRTNCDTEVILYAWREWGEACVERFRGMFAFALFDRVAQTLFLARDRLGIKPLYYTRAADGTFVFGSELKALLAHPEVPRVLRHDAVEDYFTLGYVPDPKTILVDVHKLSPGHTLCLVKGQENMTPRQYWDVPFAIEQDPATADVEADLIARLSEAVDIRLVAEVPLGAFLSGGVDSSAVVALMSGLQDDPVNTCSIGFDVSQYDETDYAKMVAKQYETNHSVDIVDSDDFDLLDTLAGFYDEPFADSSAIPTYRVCEAARKSVTVALSGDGGDELFAGYRRHRWHMNEERIRSRIPAWLRKAVFAPAGRLYPKLDWAPKFLRAKTTLQALAMDPLDAYLNTVSISTEAERTTIFSGDLKQKLGGYRSVEIFRDHADRCPSQDALSVIQYIDMKTYLPGDILTKVDRASMAHSLEVRVPILDHEFLGWASNLPPGLKLKGQEGKFIFKKSLEPLLPDEVLYRDKMGFGVPIERWFRGPLKERIYGLVEDGGLANTGMFDREGIKSVVDQHMSGMREHSALIWAMLMFEASLRQLGLSGGTH